MRKKNQRKQRLAISNVIVNNAEFINHLAKMKSGKKRCAIITGATTEELLALVEIALNILHAKEPFWTKKQLSRLMANAQLIRKLARVRSPDSARQLLVHDEIMQSNRSGQHGRGAPLVALAGILSSVLVPYIVDRILG